MKTTTKVILALTLIVGTFTTNAQSFSGKLDSAIVQFDTSQTISAKMQVSAKLDLLAAQFNTEWSVNYYAAYAKAMISYIEPDTKKRDLLLDEADRYFAKIKMVSCDSSEKYVLAALLANARLSVDGQNRWKEYGAIFDQNLQKAKAINPENPRIYYLKGVSLFYTPKMFGGGKKKAKEYFDKATPLFQNQVKSALNPYWGQKENEDYINKCNAK